MVNSVVTELEETEKAVEKVETLTDKAEEEIKEQQVKRKKKDMNFPFFSDTICRALKENPASPLDLME